MILTNNSIPQFQNGLKGNTIPDTELKYFAKARFIHFTTRFRYCLFAIPGSYTREYCRSCSFYVYLVAMCARSYRRMWVRHTREANSNSSARQETLHSEPDETFNEREGWKRERERDRSGWIKRRAEIVARLWYLKSISGSCHEPWTHNRRPRRSFIFFLPALHRPASILTVAPISRAKPDDTFQKCQPRN